MPLPEEVIEQLPEDLRENPALVQFNDVADLAKSYVETKSMVGNSLRIPNADAGDEAYGKFIDDLVTKVPNVMLKPDLANPEQSDEFFKTLGVPDDFSKYENPEGATLDTEVEAELRQMLHKARLTPSQYQAVINQMSEMNAQALENNTTVRQEDLKTLDAEWGNAKEDRLAAARKTNEEFFPGRDFETLNSAEIKGLYQVHASVTGTGMQAAAQPASVSTRLTPQEAESAAQEILRNPALYKDDTPAAEKKRMMDKVIKLRLEAGMQEELPRAGY